MNMWVPWPPFFPRCPRPVASGRWGYLMVSEEGLLAATTMDTVVLHIIISPWIFILILSYIEHPHFLINVTH